MRSSRLYRDRNIGTLCFPGLENSGIENFDKKRNCIVISTTKKIEEMRELVSSIGYNVICEVIQNREKPDNRYYLGKGKVHEVKKIIESLNGTYPSKNNSSRELEGVEPEKIAEYKSRLGDNKIELVIACAELKPSQVFNLRKILNVEVFDRIRLILEIFSERAQSEEAKLQVELARLQYEIPMVKELIHRTKCGEHPGLFFAGGEYGVDVYLNKIKSRINRIKLELQKIESERSVKRKHRRKTGFYLASIVGYTNAGKSSLLNILTKENVIVENRLFSTLSTTTRRVARDDFSLPILFTDTVGFIEDLPHWMIEAFHSTLEEISLSDIVLLVVDISDPVNEIVRKFKTSYEVILKGDCKPKIIVVFNKKDLVPDEEINYKIDCIRECSGDAIESYVVISAKMNVGISDLAKKICDMLKDTKYAVVKLPISDGIRGDRNVLEWLKAHSKITLFETEDCEERSWIHIEAEIKDRYVKHVCELISGVGGKITFV
ncbi:MAG: GTPase HflX [Thermoplasmata archaeon]